MTTSRVESRKTAEKPKRSPSRVCETLLPWERKISPRPLGRVDRPWPRRLSAGVALGGGVFVLWDLHREQAHVVGSASSGLARAALRHVRTAERFSGNCGRSEPLISRGAAALWLCSENDPKVRAEAVEKLLLRYSHRSLFVALEARP